MEKVKRPIFRVTYTGRDITEDVSPLALRVRYVDYDHGRADELDITLEDRNRLWQGEWYPGKGDEVELKIGYEDQELLPCGAFEIDEIELSGPPDSVIIKGLGPNVKKALRQENTIAWENMTLDVIARKIAQKHGLVITGDVKPVKIERITQNHERDLAFLKRLAQEYGNVFKVTDNRLVFYDEDTLETAESIFDIMRTDVKTFSFRDKTQALYKACEVSYHEPKTKELISHTVYDANIVTGDVLKINERCEDKAQAIKKAEAALGSKNKLETTASLTLPGETAMVAGSNINIKGFAKFDGKYHIVSSAHTLSRTEGYETALELKRVKD